MPSIINATTTNGVAISPDNSGSLQLATNNGTTAVTIDTSQNVGIGTSSPGSRLAILESTNGNSILNLRNTNAGSSATSILALGNDGALNGAYLVLNSSTNTAGGGGNSLNITNGFNAPMTFATNNTERMRITSGGDLCVGTTTASDRKLYVSGGVSGAHISTIEHTNNTSPVGLQIYYTAAAPNNTGNGFLTCLDNAATRAVIRSNGGLANYSANNVNLSDAREKTNIELAGSYLDKICSIPVKTFNYIDQNLEEDGGLTLGVIAQDVQAVAPELVMESNWANQDEPEKMRLSIYQTDLQYALMKCIQELKAELDTVKAELNTLKNPPVEGTE